MSEQADQIQSYLTEKKTTLDYLLSIVGWAVSCISIVIIGLITYWAIKIPEKNINNLPIINAIKGDIRVEPIDPGGKSFNDGDLSIYKQLDNIPNLPEKNDIILNKSDKNFKNIREDIKSNDLSDGDEVGLTLAIEDALRQVVNDNVKDNEKVTLKDQKDVLRLYLGSFDTFSRAVEFKQFIRKRNETLLKDTNLKIYERLEGEKKVFRVHLINISSEQVGNNLCSILSSRQFSCLLFKE